MAWCCIEKAETVFVAASFSVHFAASFNASQRDELLTLSELRFPVSGEMSLFMAIFMVLTASMEMATTVEATGIA